VFPPGLGSKFEHGDSRCVLPPAQFPGGPPLPRFTIPSYRGCEPARERSERRFSGLPVGRRHGHPSSFGRTVRGMGRVACFPPRPKGPSPAVPCRVRTINGAGWEPSVFFKNSTRQFPYFSFTHREGRAERIGEGAVGGQDAVAGGIRRGNVPSRWQMEACGAGWRERIHGGMSGAGPMRGFCPTRGPCVAAATAWRSSVGGGCKSTAVQSGVARGSDPGKGPWLTVLRDVIPPPVSPCGDAPRFDRGPDARGCGGSKDDGRSGTHRASFGVPAHTRQVSPLESWHRRTGNRRCVFRKMKDQGRRGCGHQGGAGRPPVRPPRYLCGGGMTVGGMPRTFCFCLERILRADPLPFGWKAVGLRDPGRAPRPAHGKMCGMTVGHVPTSRRSQC